MTSPVRWFLLVLVAFLGARWTFSAMRVRFSLLALLIGALSLFAAAPAEAQTIPTKPRNVQVAPGNAKLTLTWQAPSSWGTGVMPRGYEIDWSVGASAPEDNSSDWEAISPDPAVSPTSYTFTGTYAVRNGRFHTVANGIKYWFRIRAFTTYPNNPLDTVPGNYVKVSGTPVAQQTPTQSTDATLSALTASTSTSASGTFTALTLSPSTFAAATTAYTATVANTVTHVKITPTTNDSNATVEVGKGSSLTAVTSGNASGPISLSVGADAITVKVTAQDGSTTKTYTVTVTRPPPTVSLSASPNPVTEGSSVTVTATLARALSSSVTIPVTLTAVTAESGDYGTLTSISIAASATSGTGTVSTNQDADEDDETFTVSLGTLPSSVTVGSPSSVTITISDNDKPYVLSVNATPACGTSVTDLSMELEPLIRLSLDPPASMTEAQYVGIDNNAGGQLLGSWRNAGMFSGNGKLSIYVNSVVQHYRRMYPSFAGFKFRLANDHSVMEQCTWRFNSGNTGRTKTDGGTTTGGSTGSGTSTGGGSGGGPPTDGGGGDPSPPGGGDEPQPEDEEPSAPCPQGNRETLGSFYDMTGGDNWDENENWNSDEAPQEWFGVETDEDGNVVSLRLSHNALSGEVPARELLCLKELKELALWGNDGLSGEVPEELVLRVERAVLRDIAEMLDLNPEWFENYEAPYNFEDWHGGVTTDDEGRVTELDFTEEDIEGEIPALILEQLGQLETFYLNCTISVEGDAPSGVSVTMPDDCPEEEAPPETTSSGGGGCALTSEDDSSAFGLFLLALLVFAALGRTRARG